MVPRATLGIGSAPAVGQEVVVELPVAVLGAHQARGLVEQVPLHRQAAATQVVSVYKIHKKKVKRNRHTHWFCDFLYYLRASLNRSGHTEAERGVYKNRPVVVIAERSDFNGVRAIILVYTLLKSRFGVWRSRSARKRVCRVSNRHVSKRKVQRAAHLRR